MQYPADWVPTPKTESIGPITFNTTWWYDYDGDTSHYGGYVNKPSEDVYYDRKYGCLYGPPVTIQRTFSQREIAEFDFDLTPFHKEVYRSPQDIVFGFYPPKAMEWTRQDGGYYYLTTPFTKLAWTDQSEREFVEYYTQELSDHDNYPDIMYTIRNDDGSESEELEWELVEIFEDGSARYESQAPELLDASFSTGMGRGEYRYIEGFMHLPVDWSEVPVEERAEMIKYCIQDVKRLKGYSDNDWSFVGINMDAQLNGKEVATDSLWGIESDADESYFMEIYNNIKEQCISEIKEELRKKEQRIQEVEFSYTKAELELANYLKEKYGDRTD